MRNNLGGELSEYFIDKKQINIQIFLKTALESENVVEQKSSTIHTKIYRKKKL